jgi:enterochelin esterase-like enzyme
MTFLCTSAGRSQDSSSLKGFVEQVIVHGKGLEHNLSGDSPDREVSVYLPPGYKTSGNKRYPVVYFLHGFTDNNRQWYGIIKHWINLPEVVNQAFRDPQVKEMIIVTPNAYTRFQGSMYSTSVTTGDWENYVARELVAYVDSHYRTIAEASSRGLAGHSMGGYGTMRIGQKHPEIFSSIYLLSPCCMMPDMNATPNPQTSMKIAAIKTLADFEKADFGVKAAFASAAAWSPNPKKPPFFLDLPIDTGRTQRLVAAKWAANMPLAMVDQYIPNLKLLHAIAFDAGNDDKSIAASIRLLDEVLSRYSIKHDFEVYEGNHINKISERIEKKMLQFFSNHLKFEK